MAVTKDYTELYFELLYAVGNKHPNETRHETALRYIRQAEEPSGEAKAATKACGQEHDSTLARCELPEGHTENHRGTGRGCIAQWR